MSELPIWRENEPMATPKDFGAKGDGITDDTAAMQAFFNARKRVMSEWVEYSGLSKPVNWRARAEAAESERDALVKVLEEYADPLEWQEGGSFADGGYYTAREALNRLRGEG